MQRKIRIGLEAGKDTLELAEELGIGGVPITVDQLVGEGPEATLKPLRSKGLDVCQIGAFGFNPLAPDRDASRAAGEVLEKALPLVGETGCPFVVIPPGSYQASPFGLHDPRNHTAEAVREFAEALKPFVEKAEKHDVCLTIEPYLKGIVDGPESFRMLHSFIGSDRLRANIDPSSLYDYRDCVDARPKIDTVCEGFAGHYGLIHFKEIALQKGFHLKMGLVPIGEGPTDWARLIDRASRRADESSWGILEHVGSPEEARRSFGILKRAAEQAGVHLV